MISSIRLKRVLGIVILSTLHTTSYPYSSELEKAHELFNAIRTGNEERVTEIVQDIHDNPAYCPLLDPASITLSPEENTPLIEAVLHNQHRIAQRLLAISSYTQANKRNNQGETALIRAIKNHHLPLIHDLLAQPYYNNCGHRIDVEEPDSHNITPLMHAIQSGNPDIVRFFITLPYVNVKKRNDAGDTIWSLGNKSPVQRVKKIISRARQRYGLKQHKKERLKENKHLALDLTTAASEGDLAQVQELLRNKRITFNSELSNEESPLLVACQEGHEAVVQELLKQPTIKINVRFLDNKKHDYSGHNDTPLIAAAREGHTCIVRMLLENPAIRVNSINSDNETALMQAAQKGQIDTLHLLLNHPGIAVERKNCAHKSALLLAISAQQSEATRILMRHPHSTVQSDLHEAWLIAALGYDTCPYNYHEHEYQERGQYTQIISHLITYGGEIPTQTLNAHNDYGETALMIAAYTNNETVIKLLLALPSIDIHATNLNGETAYMIALAKEHTTCAQLLSDYEVEHIVMIKPASKRPRFNEDTQDEA